MQSVFETCKPLEICAVVKGTNKQFEETRDGSKNAINLVSNKGYTLVGTELLKGNCIKKLGTRNSSSRQSNL